MKKRQKIKLMALGVLGFLVLSGCEETTITTAVSPGGSCTRTMVVKSDSGDLGKTAFPIAIDDSWSFSQREEKGDKLSHVYTAQKEFKSVADLNLEFYGNPQKEPVPNRRAGLEKNFRWLYSFLVYREVVGVLNPFRTIAPEVFFEKEELPYVRLWFLEEKKAREEVPQDKLDKIEKRIEEWFIRNVFEEIFSALVSGGEKLGDPELSPEVLRKNKEPLVIAFRDNQQPLEDLSLDRAFLAFEKTLPSARWGELRSLSEPGLRGVQVKYDSLEQILKYDFTNRVTMPGLIVDTNADTLEGNTVTWEVEVGRFFFMDYEMRVESRVINWWAVWVTAGFFILAAATLLFATLRRRKTPPANT